ncbi:BT_3987 domain-containing protein [Prevotella sp.]|uniref:BT_3987 domain-containing protein n=1 Tax=Prevotella sp. TaxID=59823 RepID=UPI0025E85AFF|nr:DUF1735 domain-containing protein [Prevotella sp.]
MKIYNILFCGAMLLSAAALTGCSEDETYDVYGEKTNRVYVDPTQSNVTECTVYKTPIGLCGDALANVHVRMQYPAQQAVKVSGAADMSLVAEFNEQNSTEYAALPDAAVKALEIAPAELEAGKNTADLQVSLPTDARTSLTESDYVLPIRIANPGGKDDGREISTLDDKSMAYLVIHTSDEEIASLTGSKTVDCNIINTPVGVFGGVDSKFTVSLKASVYTDVQLSAEIDNSLIAAYNEENGTSYEALPSDFASALKVNATTIKPGELSGDVNVTMDSEKAKQLNGSYIIPMHIAMTYSDGTKKVFDEPVYTTIGVKETLINSNPSEMVGSDGDNSDWTCIEAVNFNKDTFNTYQWKPSAKNISEGSYIIDFGAVHKVTGFQNVKASSWGIVTSYRIYVSEDNANWVDLGSTDGCRTVRDDNRNSWYVLYGAVNVRYVKVEVTFDPNSYYWNYYDYSWAGSYVGVNTSFAFND